MNAAIAAAGSVDADLPEAQFAQALALSRGTDSEAATRAWKALIAGERADLREGARYNLGNLHLREALAHGEADIANALPLVELAKQRYRDAARTAGRLGGALQPRTRAVARARDRAGRCRRGRRPGATEGTRGDDAAGRAAGPAVRTRA